MVRLCLISFSQICLFCTDSRSRTEPSAHEDCALQHSTPLPRPDPPCTSGWVSYDTRAHSAEIGNDLGDRNTMTFPLSATTHEKSLFTYFLCGRKKRSKMSRPRFLSLFPPVSRPSQTYLKFDQKENGTVPFEFFPPLTAFEHSSSPWCPRVSLMAPSRVL